MNQRIGYVWFSTKDKHLNLQRGALQKAGCCLIYEQAASGKNTVRPEFEQCRKALRPGDTLVVWRMDRLGRSFPNLVHIVSELEQRSVGSSSLTKKMETNSAAGKLVFNIFAALADFEISLIRARPHAGFAAAHSKGRLGRRKPKLGEEQLRKIKDLPRDTDIQVADVERRYGLLRTALYKHEGMIAPFGPGD